MKSTEAFGQFSASRNASALLTHFHQKKGRQRSGLSLFRPFLLQLLLFLSALHQRSGMSKSGALDLATGVGGKIDKEEVLSVADHQCHRSPPPACPPMSPTPSSSPPLCRCHQCHRS